MISHVLILSSNDNWKIAYEDNWELDILELDGTEKLLGHRRIDGSIYKILNKDNKILATLK